MEAWVILLLWTLMSILTGMGLGRWIAQAKSNRNDGSGREFSKLIKEVTTEQNKNRVEQLIRYHNRRVAAGADAETSYNRLVKDLMKLKEETQDESRASE